MKDRDDAAQERAGGPRVAVIAGTEHLGDVAASTASQLQLPLVDRADVHSDRFDWWLVASNQGLELRDALGRKPSSLIVDFVRGRTAYRRISKASSRQPLARAVGLRRGYRRIVDATAGMGADAFQLACLGCTVVAVERSPIIAALFRDGLARAAVRQDEKLQEVIKRIQLVTDDAREFLAGLDDQERPEVIYLDPMFSNSGKTALNKKAMRICRAFAGGDDDAAELLRIARATALRRIVVKRPRAAPSLAQGVIVSCLGRRVRYDIYAPGSQTPP